MKKMFCFAVLAVACLSMMSSSPVEGCRCKGIPLHGRVRLVEHHADFDVRVVEHHADFDVRVVEHHPDACGEWRFVDHHPDFTVRWVDHHEDFSIRYVDHHPGVQRD